GTLTGNSLNFNFGTIAAGANATLTMVFGVSTTLADGSTRTNTANIATDTTDTNSSNDSSTVMTTVFNHADLAITKTAPATITVGQSITYTLSVTNNGPLDAQNVMLTDQFPSGLSFQGANASQGTGTLTGSSLNFNFGTIASGGSASLVMTFVVSN